MESKAASKLGWTVIVPLTLNSHFSHDKSAKNVTDPKHLPFTPQQTLIHNEADWRADAAPCITSAIPGIMTGVLHT